MTEWSNEFDEGFEVYRPSLPRKIFVRAVPALAAFSFSAAVALRLAGGLASQAIAPQPPTLSKPDSAQAANDRSASDRSANDRSASDQAQAGAVSRGALPLDPMSNVDLASGPTKASLDRPRNPFGGLFDPEGEDRGMPALTAQTDPVGPAFSPLQSEPLFTLVETPDTGVQLAEAAPVDDLKPSLAPVQMAAVEAPLPPARPQGLEAARGEAEDPSGAGTVVSRTVAAPLPPRRDVALSEPQPAQQQPAEAPQIKPQDAAVAPAPGPTRAAARRLRGQPQGGTQQALAANDPRSFFDKLFHPEAEQPRGPQLAYASPGGGGGLFGLGGSFPASPAPVSARGGVAVYDISAHTVYLPNGQTLEAHSGLGEYFDNPSYVHVKMRGATPPAVYKLSLRESLFHGVQALRLTPLDSGVHGRVGLLAHTFMLGARGDSNGCVSFRNYRPFLDAYMRGEISHLKVVASR